MTEATETADAPAPTATEDVLETPTAEDGVGEQTSQDATLTWRDGIQDEGLKKHAERFTSLDALVQGNSDLRKQVSKSISKPGDDATTEQIDAFREAVGVPKESSEYEFFFEEGKELSDREQKSQDHWAELFHKNNVPKDTADELVKEFRTELEAVMTERVKEDGKVVEQSKEELKEAWGDDYDKNIIFAAKASEKLFGEDYEEARYIEDKHGNFVLDNPIMNKLMAKLGRQMGEGALMGVVTGEERDTIMGKADTYREKAQEAYNKGDTKTANKFSELERQALEALDSGAIVGTHGRQA